MEELLLIGPIPPPIGGVTIHVSRLIEFLKFRKISYTFLDYRRENLFKIFRSILKHQIVHLHVTNPLYRLVVILYCKLVRVPIIFTFHGNFGRYNGFFNLIERISASCATMPIVLNKSSLDLVSKLNVRTRLVSAFIPPITCDELDSSITSGISKLRQNSRIIFATNASTVSYDVNNKEIYQISLLIEIFREEESVALVLSDPSGAYLSLFRKNNIVIPKNVMIITGMHSFYSVLKITDVLLRITTTDGDSLSIREGLFLKKSVITTNIVDRPEGVIKVNLDKDEIRHTISGLELAENSVASEVNNADILIEIYNNFLKKKDI